MASIKGLTASDQSELLEIQEDNLDAILHAIDKAKAAALEEIGLVAERYAKADTPVDTGRLRNSETHAINMDEEAVYIGTNVEYGPFVELDTIVNGKKREGHHMLYNAASQHGDEYRAILEKHMKNG